MGVYDDSGSDSCDGTDLPTVVRRKFSRPKIATSILREMKMLRACAESLAAGAGVAARGVLEPGLQAEGIFGDQFRNQIVFGGSSMTLQCVLERKRT